MKLQFEANQQFQLEAIAAITDLFEGQPQGQPEYSVISLGPAGGLFEGQESTELGVGNRLLLPADQLRENVRTVQARNGVEIDEPSTDLEAWRLFDGPANHARKCPHFSVEMETGTGKTYVYLRTIFELSTKYGFQKFVVVVPSVAIREGVLKSIQITRDHLSALYNGLEFEHFVYDAKRVNRLRQFATSNTLQVLVINIDAFRKNFTGTEDEQKSNVIYKESDKLSGRQPIEFVQAARPIVIIDEPQSVDSTERAQEAIQSLNPLCTLRYSATHRNPYNLVYRLDPIRAFEMKLVKQIVVASAVADGAADGAAFVRVDSITNKPTLQARLRIRVQGADGPKERLVTAREGSDLFALSQERAEYASGYEVTEISALPGHEYIEFSQRGRLNLGAEIGTVREEVWRAQIAHTVKQHLDKELEVRDRGIKVLSLFFVDRVANYREYAEDGTTRPGKYAETFERELASLAARPQYKALDWLRLDPSRLHNGYFAQDKRGYKDTRGDTQADDEVYNLIMRDKEKLLTLDEPLRFIFSHSALREGWDNPNVFQICTLNETRSVVKKRQEIGRGLRLPVDQNGLRVIDESVNRLYVMANESYEQFAKALQTEYEEDCGVTFGRVPFAAFAQIAEVIAGEEVPLGSKGAQSIVDHLIAEAMIDKDGRILDNFKPDEAGFKLPMPVGREGLADTVTDLLSKYRIERHIKRARDEKPNRLKKQVFLDKGFKELWDRIKARTTYRVEFSTDELIENASRAIKKMPAIKPIQIRVEAGQIKVSHGGVTTDAIAASSGAVEAQTRVMPDVLAYLQNETDLTRSTIYRVLEKSGRLGEIFLNSQSFLDAVARILRYELHQLLVDGIKYERLSGPDSEWEMTRFKEEEIVNYLTSLQVMNSIYEYVEYDSQIERRFAEELDGREDIRLFVKLPGWFQVDTPVGMYNPDWAIVKHDGDTLYLLRETKGTKDFLKLRNSEADKVRCGQRHFEALGMDFQVVTSASEV